MSLNYFKVYNNKQNYQPKFIKNLQANMSGLQSQKSPLRTNKIFYQPYYPQRSRQFRRNFPQNYHTISPITNTQQPKNILKYTAQLQKVKLLNRHFQHNDLYYPDPQKNKKRIQNMYSTQSSRRNSFSTLKPIEHRSIEQKRDQFLQTYRQKINKKQQLHLTFYNTNKKSKFIMQKFYDDQNLTERSTPIFQNMLQRKIMLNGILEGVRKSQRKFIHGF